MSEKRTEDPNLLPNPGGRTPTVWAEWDWGKKVSVVAGAGLIISFFIAIIHYGSGIVYRVERVGEDVQEVKTRLGEVEKDVAYIKGQMEEADKHKSRGSASTLLPSSHDSASE